MQIKLVVMKTILKNICYYSLSCIIIPKGQKFKDS